MQSHYDITDPRFVPIIPRYPHTAILGLAAPADTCPHCGGVNVSFVMAPSGRHQEPGPTLRDCQDCGWPIFDSGPTIEHLAF